MGEILKFIERAKKPVLKATAAGAAILTLSGCNPAIVEQVARSIGNEQGVDAPEFVERYAAVAHAKEISDALNRGEKPTVGFRDGMAFVIYPQFQDKYQAATIYNPIVLDGEGLGFVTYSSKSMDSQVTINPVDAEHGELRFADDPNAGGRIPSPHVTDLSLVNFDYTPDVQNDPENTMRIVVASDAAQTFVGQYSGLPNAA